MLRGLFETVMSVLGSNCAMLGMSFWKGVGLDVESAGIRVQNVDTCTLYARGAEGLGLSF